VDRALEKRVSRRFSGRFLDLCEYLDALVARHCYWMAGLRGIFRDDLGYQKGEL
jgi:hypothetical protein